VKTENEECLYPVNSTPELESEDCRFNPHFRAGYCDRVTLAFLSYSKQKVGQDLSRVLAVSHTFHSTQAKHYIVYEQMLNQASVNKISRITQRVVLKIKLT